MHAKRFWLLSLLQFVILIFARVYYFNHQLFDSIELQTWVFWGFNAVLAAAFVRRMGVMNFLESFFVAALWLVGGVLLDLLITSAYVGTEIFAQKPYWGGYLFLILSLLIFHKKRHVHVRHEMHHAKMQAQQHHGHEKKKH